MSLQLKSLSLSDAIPWVSSRHRHELLGRQRPCSRGRFAIAATIDSEIVAVAIVGSPKARHYDDGDTVEVVRLASTGARNACSFLYGHSARAARALGFKSILTYTLQSEPGASLRAAGWVNDAKIKGRQWSSPSRPRQLVLVDDRLRWWAPWSKWLQVGVV